MIAVIREVGLENKPLMMGETSSCWGGGAPKLSDRYAGGFLYVLVSGLGSITMINKAIRDGKYLAPPHASAWQRSPHSNRIF